MRSTTSLRPAPGAAASGATPLFVPLTISVDTCLLEKQVAQLHTAAALLPRRRAQRFYRKALRLLQGLAVSRVPSHHRFRDGLTSDFRFQARAAGLDALIAAAFRAGRSKRQGGPDAQ